MSDPLDFSAKAVLITGGNRGIGRGIAEAFLEAGANVAVCGRKESEELPSAGGRNAIFVAADVRDAEQVEAMVNEVVERLGRLDVLVNNAGGSLAIEWGPKVRVNAVSAGMIRTEQAHLHYGDEAGVARIADTIPLKRLGTPGDVAGACLYLVSPLASYVSGANLVLHGGGETPAFLTAANADRGE